MSDKPRKKRYVRTKSGTHYEFDEPIPDEQKRKKKTLLTILSDVIDETVEETYVSIIPESKESAERNKKILKFIFSTIVKAKLSEKVFD